MTKIQMVFFLVFCMIVQFKSFGQNSVDIDFSTYPSVEYDPTECTYEFSNIDFELFDWYSGTDGAWLCSAPTSGFATKALVKGEDLPFASGSVTLTLTSWSCCAGYYVYYSDGTSISDFFSGQNDFVVINNFQNVDSIEVEDVELGLIGNGGGLTFRFEGQFACNFGDPCDDGNAGTINDVIKGNCMCEGTPASSGTTCDGLVWNTPAGALTTGTYHYEDSIVSQASTVEANSDVTFKAGEAIRLLPGFHAKAGSQFHALIESCPVALLTSPEGIQESTVNLEQIERQDSKRSFQTDEPFLKIVPNPVHASAEIFFQLPQAGEAGLSLYDLNGRLVRTLMPQKVLDEERQSIRMEVGHLSQGVYFLTLQGDNYQETQRMVVVR